MGGEGMLRMLPSSLSPFVLVVNAADSTPSLMYMIFRGDRPGSGGTQQRNVYDAVRVDTSTSSSTARASCSPFRTTIWPGTSTTLGDDDDDDACLALKCVAKCRRCRRRTQTTWAGALRHRVQRIANAECVRVRVCRPE